jgi:acetyl-CoA C-acetyltransferase
MNQDNDVVIVAAKRTPMGNLLGTLSTQTAPLLGASAHVAALRQANLQPEAINEVISGCVLQAGIGQAPARQAAIKAGVPYSAGATTINKMCGSGMKAVMLGADLIGASSSSIVLAGGMESMSNAPYLLKKARAGYRLGHGECFDHLFLDGLEDAYEPGKLMGVFADEAAKTYGFSRKAQDDYAIESMTRALAAQQSGAFDAEITPVMINQKHQTVEIKLDEGPDKAKIQVLFPMARQALF